MKEQTGQELVTAISDDMLVIVPMRNIVLFPGVVTPVAMKRAVSVAAAQEASRSGRQIGFLLQKDADEDSPKTDDLHPIGTVANVCLLYTSPSPRD